MQQCIAVHNQSCTASAYHSTTWQRHSTAQEWSSASQNSRAQHSKAQQIPAQRIPTQQRTAALVTAHLSTAWAQHRSLSSRTPSRRRQWWSLSRQLFLSGHFWCRPTSPERHHVCVIHIRIQVQHAYTKATYMYTIDTYKNFCIYLLSKHIYTQTPDSKTERLHVMITEIALQLFSVLQPKSAAGEHLRGLRVRQAQ